MNPCLRLNVSYTPFVLLVAAVRTGVTVEAKFEELLPQFALFIFLYLPAWSEDGPEI